MAGTNNNQSEYLQRLIDVADEPLAMLTPIRGYDEMPLVSLEEAAEPLELYIPEIQHMVYIAKSRCTTPPPDNLTVDQSAAIMLYTLEWQPRESSVYFRLNRTLRTEDRQLLKPWLLYLKLFFTALSLIPRIATTVFRGMKGKHCNEYKKGQIVTWWGFSSCTKELDVLHNEAFLGSSGSRALFTIQTENGRNIEKHSYFQKEHEILLPAARVFKVNGILPQKDGLVIIHMQEIKPKYPLLESFTTIGQLVQSITSVTAIPMQLNLSSPPVSYKPVSIQPIQTSLNYNNNTNSNTYMANDKDKTPYNTKDKSDSNYCLICCGLLYCCPCTVCYLLCKN